MTDIRAWLEAQLCRLEADAASAIASLVLAVDKTRELAGMTNNDEWIQAQFSRVEAKAGEAVALLVQDARQQADPGKRAFARFLVLRIAAMLELPAVED